jgi:N-glycosylase/DNA lyase
MSDRGKRTPSGKMAFRDVRPLQAEFATNGRRIRARLREFRTVGARSDRELFEELSFCILAVQTKARASDAAVRSLAASGLLWSGDEAALSRTLRRRVRFHNHKASYILRVRNRFFAGDGPGLKKTLDRVVSSADARSWLVREIDGLGLKEASHFLRNIGRGSDLAILDRHVLRSLVRHGVIRRMPASLTPRRYLAIERKMAAFAEAIGIPLAALDLLFWSRETGEIFK